MVRSTGTIRAPRLLEVVSPRDDYPLPSQEALAAEVAELLGALERGNYCDGPPAFSNCVCEVISQTRRLLRAAKDRKSASEPGDAAEDIGVDQDLRLLAARRELSDLLTLTDTSAKTGVDPPHGGDGLAASGAISHEEACAQTFQDLQSIPEEGLLGDAKRQEKARLCGSSTAGSTPSRTIEPGSWSCATYSSTSSAMSSPRAEGLSSLPSTASLDTVVDAQRDGSRPQSKVTGNPLLLLGRALQEKHGQAEPSGAKSPEEVEMDDWEMEFLLRIAMDAAQNRARNND
mmetsp:Transcript_3714/g.9549  ORF Transcript_3714/g.9549 Transcript_3714/m.9549 type:complete len:288 (-) Transcript_3714:86-949(-)